MAAVLVWSTPLRRRIWRFRLVLFLVRMWRLYAPARLMLPLPRTLKRLAAPRLDFIFGIKTSFSLTPGGPLRERLMPRLSLVARLSCGGLGRWSLLRLRLRLGYCCLLLRHHLLLRRQHHHHLPALELRKLLDHADGVEILAYPLEQALAELLVSHLAAAESQRHLRLVAFLQELNQLAELDLVVALVGSRAELDFLDLDLLLLELRLVRFFLLAVAELAVVHQLADRRYRERRDLHQVHVRLLGQPQGFDYCLDAELITVFRYQAHFRGGDFPVDALRPCFECDE